MIYMLKMFLEMKPKRNLPHCLKQINIHKVSLLIVDPYLIPNFSYQNMPKLIKFKI